MNHFAVKIESSWEMALKSEFEKEYFKLLLEFVRDEYQQSVVYPNAQNIFRAFDVCPFDKVKVVILGQDPYHDAGQANGLCFSVGDTVKIPPSLRNIYKEVESDLGIPSVHKSGDLERWAQQGVLLLNVTLTVSAHTPGSHQGKGWEQFTDAIIKKLSDERDHIVFILWGNYARKKGAHIDKAKHLVIESAHPSPLSAYNGFFGSKPFSRANAYLVEHEKKPINWL